MKAQAIYRKLGQAFVGLGALFLVAVSELNLTWFSSEQLQRRSEFYLPKVSALRPLLLGHDGLLADLMWIRTLSYTADEVFRSRKLLDLERLVDFITDLDPRFERVYIWAGAVTIYSGGPIHRQKIDASNKILLKGWNTIVSDPRGWRHVPDYWNIPYMLGFNYAFELKEPEKGAPFIAQAAQIPGSPPILKTYAATLLKRTGRVSEGAQALETAVLIDYLNRQLDQADTDEAKQKLRVRLGMYYRQLYGDREYQAKLLAFEEHLQTWVKKWRQNYPQISFRLYLQLFENMNEPEPWSLAGVLADTVESRESF